MIKYRLRCERGHEFEGWFRSSGDFDTQAKRGLLSCSDCGSPRVGKAIMAPNVSPSDRRAAAPAGPPQAAAEPQLAAAAMPPELVEMARKIRRHLRDNAENVGPRFAEEARRIHYNESERRGIYGEATPREAVELREEGIEVMPLPPLPSDAN